MSRRVPAAALPRRLRAPGHQPHQADSPGDPDVHHPVAPDRPGGRPRRALALVRSATGLPPLTAHSIVVTTDATATAVLRAAGIPPEDARPILVTLWPLAPRPAEPRPGSRPPGQDDAGQREQQFVRDLGQRIHVIRHARRLTPTGVRNRTGIPPYLLRDLEAGDLWPSTYHLYRLAHAFAVRLPLLVDDSATPLRILRLLSGQTG